MDDPDCIGSILQINVFNKLYASLGKPKRKDILLGCMKKIQSLLNGFFPREYVKKATELMLRRARNELPYGGFKWGMVALYYELKELKHKYFHEELENEIQMMFDLEEMFLGDDF